MLRGIIWRQTGRASARPKAAPDLESSAAYPEDKAGSAVEADGPPITAPDAPNVEAEAIAQAQDRAVETTDVGTAVRSTPPTVSATIRLPAPYRSPLPRRPLPT